jgi:hypothetical protein
MKAGASAGRLHSPMRRARPVHVKLRRLSGQGNRTKPDSSGFPVIARSEATRQSPSERIRDGDCFASLAMTGIYNATEYPHAFTRLPWLSRESGT